MRAPASPPAPAAADAIEPSAADRLFDGFDLVLAWVRGFTPAEAGINLALSLLVAAVALGVLWLGRRAARLALHRLTPAAGALRGAAVTWALVKVAVFAAAALAVLSLWGLDLIGWATRGGGAAALRTSARIVVLLVVFVAAFELVGAMIERVMGRTAERVNGERRTAQVRTLIPLLKAIARTVLVVIGAMTLLSEFGVQIGPLLAGAGVLGVAVGFGAQTIVKDLLTGVSLVLEDTVSLGDIVQVGEVSGVVETMTMRTIRLRDYDGTLHIIPYSEAQIIHNKTKTFSRFVFNISVAYEADLDEALEVMRRVGAELRDDPAFGPKILEDLEVAGVDSLADSAVVLKARIKTAPGAQWAVGREYQRRIKLALDEAGIEIPFPHLKLVMPTPAPIAAGAAASA